MGKHAAEPGGSMLADADGVLFDLDGVLTPTAELHRRAWAATFTAFFRAHLVEPAYAEADYFAHIDGKPRFAGVMDMLAARQLSLPFGDPTDPPGDGTICAVGNSKNQAFNAILQADPVAPYPGATDLLDALARQNKPVAIVSSSANAKQVLRAAELLDRFDVIVDGQVATAEELAGKPAPDTFVWAARRLGLYPLACAVVEDAIAGVAAARAGGFGLVVGVDRGTGEAALRANGADLVVTSLTQLLHGPTTS
ncbi:MAG: HAD-IA family hydrolase [Micrococcales bacterium]|nr:HAD-IA family hydrolase [Micrococcales bacterium]